MKFFTYTRFPALTFDAEDQFGQDFHVVVARSTWTMTPWGALAPAQQQAPLLFEDEDWARPEMTPYNGKERCTRQESDLAPYKPNTDIIVLADAHAPHGKPSRRWTAGIRVQAPPRAEQLHQHAGWEHNARSVVLDKSISVTGARWWRKRLGGWELTDPEPATRVPLTYAYAYGGEVRLLDADDRVAHMICEDNPVGRGHAPQSAPRPILQFFDTIGRVPAPQLESATDPIRDWGRIYDPVGFGAMGRTWRARYRHVGHFEAKSHYAEDEFPKIPLDFNFSYWNVAHPEMQVPYLAGDESIYLLNCCPWNAPGSIATTAGQLQTIQLPGDYLYLRVEDVWGRIGTKAMALDTVMLEPTELRVTLIWRCTIPAEAMLRVCQLRHETPRDTRSRKHLSEFTVARLAMRMATYHQTHDARSSQAADKS